MNDINKDNQLSHEENTNKINDTNNNNNDNNEKTEKANKIETTSNIEASQNNNDIPLTNTNIPKNNTQNNLPKTNETPETNNKETPNINSINNDENKVDKEQINSEQKEIIMNESRIMHDEQLVDVNQSSFIDQSLNITKDYIKIYRDDNAPFTIEESLKFDKKYYLQIFDYLTLKEKIIFTGINRCFNFERITILNNKREELIQSLNLKERETLDDLIVKIKLKYSNEELSKPFTQFQVARGAAKAVELLNNDLYSKLFKKAELEKHLEEIYVIYRVLFVLIDEFDIANIPEDKIFWLKCTEYLISNSNGKIGSFILEKTKNIEFSHNKIVLLNKLLVGDKKKINPSYFSKLCGTTGLLVFLIKDALEYCGVIISEKKTQASRILDNLMYYKNTIETLAKFIDFLANVKHYKLKQRQNFKE